LAADDAAVAVGIECRLVGRSELGKSNIQGGTVGSNNGNMPNVE
jgi:hypothetical protein